MPPPRKALIDGVFYFWGKCATHVDICTNIQETSRILKEDVTHVDIYINPLTLWEDGARSAGEGTKRNQIIHSKKTKAAFTLAEVLITLGIIGVVAALTLPNLIANYQKKQAVTQLKATYSVLAQAFERAKADYGDMETWGLDSIRGQTSGEKEIYTNFAETYFVPYIKTIKNYKITSLKTIGYKNIYKLDGTPDTSLLDTPRYYVILPNGTITGFQLDGHCDASHEDSDGNTVCDSQWYYTDLYIVTDINGKKAPNTLGKDIFVMSTMDNQFGFYRYKGLESNREWLLKACSKGSKENRHCGRLIQYDGWEIKDDYPW